jgi:hypothetical protein
MISSAVLLAALGLLMTFDADGVLRYTGSHSLPFTNLIVESAGALYLGFAILNWMAKDNLIGGIYSRPVALANLLQFFATAMSLIRAVSGGLHVVPLLAVTFFYIAFALWFGLVCFGSPVARRAD